MDPDPGKKIEVDPDPDPRQGLKWIRIRIRPNAVDPGGSGTLIRTHHYSTAEGLTNISLFIKTKINNINKHFFLPFIMYK